MNTNYEALNMKINELTKHVSDVEFELQNPNYIDIDYEDNMEADYFTNDTASSRADFYITNTHREINLHHNSVPHYHQTTPNSQLTVRDTYTSLP